MSLAAFPGGTRGVSHGSAAPALAQAGAAGTRCAGPTLIGAACRDPEQPKHE